MQPTVTTTSASSSSSATGKPDRLYIGNLSPTVDEFTLIQVFQKHGKITKLDFMFHKTGVLKGKPRGFAFVEFSNKDVSNVICHSKMTFGVDADVCGALSLVLFPKDALKAMVKLHDRLLRGRKLVVTYASSVR